MDLLKPPVIEVGIEFHFEPRQDKARWEQEARNFVEQFRESFPAIEMIHSEQIRIEKRTAQGMPTEISGQISLDRIRAKNAEGTRCLQVGNDLLVYNLLKKGTAYPGFGELRREALDMLDRYVGHFAPEYAREATVTYLDLIEIPSAQGQVRLEDYFRLRVECPDEPFGSAGAFSLQLQFPGGANVDQLTLWLKAVPSRPAEEVCRFRLYWNCRCDDVNTLDRPEISRRLDRAHVRLRDCFRASFTPKGWALFHPLETT